MDTMILDERDCWTAVERRDRAADGRFVYAVRTTGVFCRPSCGSRRPRRENVAFFPLPAAAKAGGFRACRRCRPEATEATDPRAALVGRACRLIEAAEDRVPGLAELGRGLGTSPFHLQRLMRQLLGLSPREYADALRMRRFRGDLKAGEGIASATFGAGFGSSSRVYERAARELGMTPGRYRAGAAGERIAYATGGSPLGRVLVAATDRGVCFVALGAAEAPLVRELEAEFPGAAVERDEHPLSDALATVLRYLEGRLPHPDLPLDLRGTAFQRRVWQELQKIPPGSTTTYTEIARRIGAPRAIRAVGRACATNPVSLAVPCHRVLRGDGGLAGYRWGIERKRALIDREAERPAKERRRARG